MPSRALSRPAVSWKDPGGANAGPVSCHGEVRLLGPFELATIEGPQRLPGQGERGLLAVLALSAGRAVALPTLIDAL